VCRPPELISDFAPASTLTVTCPGMRRATAAEVVFRTV
jgi:hypothetical protein